MAFPPIPPELKDLHPLGCRLLALRVPIMQLYAAPEGRQYKVHGNVVNVPVDVMSTISTLPRLQSEDLSAHGGSNQHMGLSVSNSVNQKTQSDDCIDLSADGRSNQHTALSVSNSVNQKTQSDDCINSNELTHQNISNSDNESVWSETDSDYNINDNAGIQYTMLTTPDFSKDSERDLVHSIVPGQHSTPLSFFKDQDSEELTLVNT